MKNKAVFTPSSSVVAQIARLPDMKMDEIKSLWKKLYQKDPPTHIRPYLERRLAYKMQELEFRRKHEDIVQNNERRIKAIIDTTKKPLRGRSPAPGTVLTRIYQDKEHQVTVMPDGQFEYQRCIYKSLSSIAREITGTRWSGPLFFGTREINHNKKTKRGKQ